jgi:hypothetical protein
VEGKQVVNPHLGEAIFTLKDGVPRRFCWDMNAMAVYVEVSQSTKLRPTNFVAVLRALLFAGLHSDAEDRGEEWTLRKVGSLVSPEQIDELLERVSELKKRGLEGPGESQASVAVAGKRKSPRRGTGARR